MTDLKRGGEIALRLTSKVRIGWETNIEIDKNGRKSSNKRSQMKMKKAEDDD